MRLQKFLAEAGVGSRRACEELIRKGAVVVNERIASIGQSVDPAKDRVVAGGKTVQISPKVYILFNKPRGVLSTVSDPFNRSKVLDLVKIKGRIYPVGRLDKDSEGLMLLTNDGELAYRLTHPKFGVQKVYVVRVRGVPPSERLVKARGGIRLEDGMTAPCEIRIVKIFDRGKNALLEIKIHEGKKREIRRMMAALRHPVISLRRISIGPLSLSNLPPGAWRFLTLREIKAVAGRA